MSQKHNNIPKYGNPLVSFSVNLVITGDLKRYFPFHVAYTTHGISIVSMKEVLQDYYGAVMDILCQVLPYLPVHSCCISNMPAGTDPGFS